MVPISLLSLISFLPQLLRVLDKWEQILQWDHANDLGPQWVLEDLMLDLWLAKMHLKGKCQAESLESQEMLMATKLTECAFKLESNTSEEKKQPATFAQLKLSLPTSMASSQCGMAQKASKGRPFE